jgi:superfamily II DNA or RNA helicase
MDELFKSVRQACSANIWSRGVELARSNSVVGEKISDAEAVLRVASPERAASATVKLWPDDEDWLCDCQSPSNPCEHVAAAVIALRRAKEQGKALPISNVVRGLVVYRFRRDAGKLLLERRIRVGEEETRLTSSLATVLSGLADGPAVSATKEDLTVDSISAKAPLADTLRVLKGTEQAYLDDKKISIGGAAPGVRAVLADGGEGVRVTIEPDPAVEEHFGNGVVLLGGALRPIEPVDLSRLARTYGPGELAELASHILPKLKEAVPVDIRTTRLPQLGDDSRPRLLMQTQASGDTLSVLPLIVYGDPPYARVDGGKLVLLGGGAVAPTRNIGAEDRLARSLQSEFGFSVGRRADFRGEAAETFAARLREWKGAVAGNGLSFYGSRPDLAARLSVEDGRLSLSFSLPGGGAVDTTRVFQSWREGMTRVPLLDGSGWAPLPSDWLERYGDRVLALLQAKGSDGKVAVYARPELVRLCEEMNAPCPPEFTRLRLALENFTGIPAKRLPEDLKATLRPYQQHGVDWLAYLRGVGLGALLADDMGLGKTIQAMCAFSGPVLVVAPTSVLPNWRKELDRFRPGLRYSIYHGPNRKLHPLADVTLTTYAILRLDAAALASEEWDMVVLDEAQNIKNPESQTAQAAYRLRAGFRCCLTGTPVENRLEDLWSLFHFLNPGLLGGRNEFQKSYAAAELLDAPKIAHLRSRIRPFILRRLKQEVAPELPPRTEIVLYCDLEKPERETYDAILAATRNEVIEKLSSGGGVLAALEALLRLRQAACHPSLLPGSPAIASAKAGTSAPDSSKVKLLCEKLDEVVSEGHKALVFSQWTSLLDLIQPRLSMPYLRIDGSTPAAERSASVDKFQSDSGPPVLLMTLKAGGTGLNLTAADYVFLVDPWWNPAAEDQAADRAHRIGQDRPVFVNRLVARDTVEEKILVLQESKRAAAAAALGGAGRAAAITREELMELLS